MAWGSFGTPFDALAHLKWTATINKGRTERGALPVMRGELIPPLELHMVHVRTAAEVATVNAHVGEGYAFRTTMLAPITHGVAPQSLKGLAPILLSEAITGVNMIHAGRVLFLTSVATAFRTVGVQVLGQDANGARVLCFLYNYVRPEEDPAAVFPPGTRLAMMEPYLRFPLDDPKNPACVRCDNPQAVRVFASTRAWERAQRGDFEEEEAEPVPSASLDALCRDGNTAFGAGRVAEAVRLYTSALRVDPASSRALGNRAVSHVKLGRWAAALQDAEGALALDATHKKAAFRRAEALLLLQRPLQAREAAVAGALSALLPLLSSLRSLRLLTQARQLAVS